MNPKTMNVVMRSLRLSLMASLLWGLPVWDAMAQGTPAVSFPLRISAEQQAAFEARRAEEANAQIEVRAIGSVAGEPVALIDVNGHPVMVRTRITIIGWDVSAITESSQEVVLTRGRSGTTRVLQVTNPRSISFPVLTDEQVERLLSVNHIRDQAQANRISSWPHEVWRVWSRINRDGQEAILLNYLQAGQVMGWIVDTNGQSSSGFSGHLLEKKLHQRRSEKRQAFLASLDEKQREVFMAAGAVINFVKPPPPAERERMMAQARALEEERAKVVAALTPAQRLLYDNYMGMLGQPPSR